MIHQNSISWFEIPVEDLQRAQTFYETIFDMKMASIDLPNFQMRTFPTSATKQETVSGALVKTQPGFYHPSNTHGILIYLNANPNVQLVVNKVEAAGGKILVPKTKISDEYGCMAIIEDTEGNRIGLHNVPE